MLNFIGAFIILININVNLALIAFLFVPLMGIYEFYFSKKMYAALRKSSDRIGDINVQVEDTLAGIRVVQSFTNEEVEKKKFTYENDRFVEIRQKGYKAEAYFYDGLMAFTQLMTIAVVIFGAASIVKGSLALADLLIFLLYIVILIEPIQRLGNFIRLYQQGITGFNRFMEILEVEPDIQDSPNADDLTHVRGEIEFQNVDFKYKEDYDHVLKNISLKINVGEYVALVGPSGVGKTTLCSLVPRFYEVSEGKILIDGQDIKSLKAKSLRKNIGLVHQDVYLFAGTVLENIRYGNPDATEEEIITAAKQANAHRLSTVKNAKRILVLTDNGIEEQGTHEELIRLNGTYAHLYNVQDTV